MLDYHVILDLLPTIASLYFTDRFSSPPPSSTPSSSQLAEVEDLTLSAVQSSILLALGCQRKTVEQVETELNLPVSQTLALFVKVMRKISKRLNEIQRADVQASLPPPPTQSTSRVQLRVDGVEGSEGEVLREMEDELDEAGDEVLREKREKQREIIDSLDLTKYVLSS
jgi:N-acetyltransferase 10